MTFGVVEQGGARRRIAIVGDGKLGLLIGKSGPARPTDGSPRPVLSALKSSSFHRAQCDTGCLIPHYRKMPTRMTSWSTRRARPRVGLSRQRRTKGTGAQVDVRRETDQYGPFVVDELRVRDAVRALRAGARVAVDLARRSSTRRWQGAGRDARAAGCLKVRIRVSEGPWGNSHNVAF